MDFQKTVLALTPEEALEAERAAMRTGQGSLSSEESTHAHSSILDLDMLEAEGALGNGLGRLREDGVSLDDQPTIGYIGRYALKYRLGEGGLGTVYAAQDPLLSRLVAIKTVSLEMSPEAREQFNAMFLNEARAAAGLNHPNIVTVFDAGTSPQGAYIAMELLKGKDLRQRLKEGWAPSPVEAALLIRRVADALSYAHAKGVVHRDIKPANIFMTGRVQPKVLDFGIARVASQQEAGGVDEFAAGSPYYMAPEQVRQAPVDRRCDVFSLGVVLYELLTGSRPFQGGTLTEIATAVVTHQPPPAHQVNPAVPPALSTIAARAMEKDPESRYRSARALARELRHWLEEQAEAAQQDEIEAAERRSRQRRWIVGALTSTLIVVLLLLNVGSLMRDDTDPVTPAAAAAAVPAPAPASAIAVPAVAVVQQPSEPAAAASLPTEAEASSAAASAEPPAPLASRPAAVAEKPEKPVETPRERRAREARERENRAASAAALSEASTGQVLLAVSPWGHVEVDGVPAGTVPPLSKLTLSEGRHTITLRNDAFPPHTLTITVNPGQPVTIRHKFGS